jgi:nucleoside-diphosphate-sugar epimerase
MSKVSDKIILEDCKRSCTDIKVFKAFKNQTILITGGTGFIGKWLAEMFSFFNESENLNIKIILLSRDFEKFIEEVPHLAGKSYLSFIYQDLRNINDIPNEVNYIINAAGSPDNRVHVSQPIKTIETFYKGTLSLFEAATRLPNLKKIVHLSSHQIYGMNENEELLNEKFVGKLDINNVYAESKRIAESLCYAYRQQFNLPILTIRPFSFLGPYQELDKPWAINNFIRDKILGGPIRILGNGLTVRSYLYASDMAFWIIKALADGQVGEAYNCGSNIGINLNDLAVKISSLGLKNVEILSKSSKENYTDIPKMLPDINKIVNDLNVMETISLDDALLRTILWNESIKK